MKDMFMLALASFIIACNGGDDKGLDTDTDACESGLYEVDFTFEMPANSTAGIDSTGGWINGEFLSGTDTRHQWGMRSQPFEVIVCAALSVTSTIEVIVGEGPFVPSPWPWGEISPLESSIDKNLSVLFFYSTKDIWHFVILISEGGIMFRISMLMLWSVGMVQVFDFHPISSVEEFEWIWEQTSPIDPPVTESQDLPLEWMNPNMGFCPLVEPPKPHLLV